MNKKEEPESTTTTRRERYNPTMIAIRSRGMSHEIEMIRRYVETVTSSFQRGFTDYEARFAKRAESASVDDLQSLGEEWGEAAGFLVDLFPAFALQTTFVATYSLLEDEMMALAGVVGEYLGITLDPEELKDKGIFAAKKYLETLCRIAFPEGYHPWQEVRHYNRIRNAIVHCRGRISRSKDEKAIRRYAEGKKLVNIDEYDRLQLTKAFCLEVLENVEALMNDLFKLARQRVA